MSASEPKSRGLLAFFLLSFALSWLVWIPTALASHDWLRFDLPSSVAGLLGAFGPTAAALVITASLAGGRGLKRLLHRIVLWRVAPKWYLFALFWPVLLSLVASVISHAMGHPLPNFSSPLIVEFSPLPPELDGVGPWPLLPFIFLQNLLIGSAMGEEVGWRGFALPRLQTRMSALSASLVLGFLWGLWHLPLYLTAAHPMSEIFFGWILLSILADAVLFTWIFNNVRGSLLLVLLLHASIATTALFLASTAESFMIAIALKWVVALGIVSRLSLNGPLNENATDEM